MINGEITKYDIKEKNGVDYLRFTIMGSDDLLYKTLFEEHLRIKLDDNTFFPEMVDAHIERGLPILYSEFKISKNKDQFFYNLLNGAK